MELDKLVNSLISDPELSSEIKIAMFTEWEKRMVAQRANTIMSKEKLEQHMSELEILHNAKNTIKTQPQID